MNQCIKFFQQCIREKLCVNYYWSQVLNCSRGRLSTLVQACCISWLYSDMVEFLNLESAARVRSPVEAKVISIFHLATFGAQRGAR